MPDTTVHPTGPDQGVGGRIATFAIRNPVTVSMIFLSIVVLGVIAVARIPLMLVPKLDAPVMFVSAPYHNATPGQVLEAITKPIEEVLATVPGVRRLSSRSGANGMSIQVWCGMNVDTSLLRSEMREKIDQIRDELPEDLRRVDVLNFSTDEIPILEGTLTANRDLRKDYEFLHSRVQRPLERIPGVGNVELWGTQRNQVDIYLRLDDIKRYGVHVGQLFRSINSANLNLSLGQISDGGRRYSAVARGTMESIEDIEQFPIGQHNLVLRDVADVVYDQPQRTSGRHHNGTHALGLAIQKTSEANTVDVVDAVTAAFDEWAQDPSMEGLTVRWWHNSAEEILSGIGELLKAGSIGAILAVIVLLAFLRRLDASLAVGLAIPFSVLTAVGLLYFNGDTLNTLTMMGLMLAAGMLVDNAVVVLEAIFRKVEQGHPPQRAARHGAGEVTLAVTAATSTTMIIFVPLMFDSESQISILLSYVGVSIVFALLCSLFISLTLIPLVAAKTLRPSGASGDGPGRTAPDGRLPAARAILSKVRDQRGRQTRIQFGARYLRLVRWNLDRRYQVGLVAVPAVLTAAYWVLINVVPDNSPDAVTVSSVRIDYDFSENYHYAKIEQDFVIPVEEYLHANADALKLRSTSSAYGNSSAWTRAYLDTDRVQPEEVAGIREAIARGLPEIPGARIDLGQDGTVDRNWFTANIYGDDPEVLGDLARQAEEALLETEGFAEVYIDRSGSRDEVQVQLRRDVARKFNVSPRTVSQLLAMTVRSQRMRSYRTPEGEVELWIAIEPSDMQSVQDLRSLVVGGGAGDEQVLLGQVADLRIERVPSQLTRENRRTFTEIAGVYRGKRTDEARDKLRAVMEGLPYEPGYSWTTGFWTKQRREDAADFAFSMLLAAAMVYFVMAALFESVLHPFAILLSMPFSVVGIALFLLLTGTPFNVMGQIGIILLIGIVVNNGIVLINHINTLRRDGLARLDAILRGCEERLRPICMTALTTIVGLIPLAWGGGSLMGISYFPLARTVMGGLMASTVLTLVVLPVYYVILDDFGRSCRRVWSASAAPRAPEPMAGD